MVKTYTIEDGLPSNLVYETLEDDNGFLWVATDNGIARFDGKRFVNYTTKNGLPSNDVIQINKEKDGTIWVNCYLQTPSYFDQKSNRFISFEDNKLVLENSKRLLTPQIDPNGGIYNSFAYGFMYFKNKKFVKCKQTRENPFFINNKQFTCCKDKKQTINQPCNYVIYNEKKEIITKFSTISEKTLLRSLINGSEIYEFYDDFLIAIQKTDENKISYFNTKIKLPNKIKFSNVTNNEVAVTTVDGFMYVYDKKTLRLKHQINTRKNANTYFKDSNKTIWITTVDNGLLKYTTSEIKTYDTNLIENSNLLSIYVDSNKIVYTGNFKGNVFTNDNINKKTFYLNKERACWVRSISKFDDKIVTVSDYGYNINFCKNKSIELALLKCAMKLNDSILILGSSEGLYQVNVFKNKCSKISSLKERIWNLKAINANEFYFVANKGLFRYNLKSKNYSIIFENSVLKNDNIQFVETDFKGRIWLSTAKGNIYLIDKNKIIFKITNSNQLPESINKLLMVNQNLWIASKTGLYILQPSVNQYKIEKISKADGLNSEFINDLFLKDNLVYAATSDGYATIPINNLEKKYNVSPNLIFLKVNNESKNIENILQLKTDETSIVLDLAGIDLTGHFKKFQYLVNDENKWIDLESNILNLILKQGENTVYIRTIDVNDNASKKRLKLKFNVAIAFYNHIWFWILIIFIFTGAMFYIFNRRKFARQKQIFQQQLALEQQRNKITADLHDEIGSSLSSLQINSAVASQLMNENPSAVKSILEKIEIQSENLAEKIGDIIWSMKPGKDQFMTMSSRMKNFANDILAATDIYYTINIDDKIDISLTDITIRKNIILLVKESINNVAKYSKATQLNVNIKLSDNFIFIEITDNGIGFEIAKVSGNGLGNMRRRVEELNGKFEIKTEINNGTTISAKIPCP